MVMGTALGLAGCSTSLPTYQGPEVTRIQVFKGQRRMQFLHNNYLLKEYRFDLGFNPIGHKEREGDGRTPEGAYMINRKNPNSQFHLSLGLSYPDRNDVARARAKGVSPGGDIFIHGTPSRWIGQRDWTWGCIAVTNEEMDEIYPMINTGTKIYLYA